MSPELVVLAAGMGSRYGGLKQVDALGKNGEAIIEYSLYDAIRAGFGKVVFVIRESIEEAFKEKFAGKFEDKIRIEYVFQEVNTKIEGVEDLPHREKPWGTAHAVLVAEPAIEAPFAVINADDYYGVAAYRQMAEFLTGKCAPDHHAMAGYILEKTISDHGVVNRGVCAMDDNHHLTEVVERHKIRRIDGIIQCPLENGEMLHLNDDDLVSMNFWGFHPHIFNIIRTQFIAFAAANRANPKAEFYIPLVANNLIQSKSATFSVLPSPDKWYGVTYQEDKPIVQEAFGALHNTGVYPDTLWT